MRKVLFFTLIFITSITSAQNEGNWWYFGQNAVIDFNSGAPVSNQLGQLNTFESCSSISDRFGNLLFYTDGSSVWNKLGNVVPNGSGLSGNSSTAQNLIIQDNLSSNLFYIITTGGFQGLRYSLFDINLDGGLGAIVASRKDILIANINTEKIHGYQDNLGNRWIVTYDSGLFYSYSFGAGVISSSSEVVSDLSMSIFMNDRRGCLKISPDGNKIAIASVGQFAGLFIADFNKSTGAVTNPVHLFNSTSTFDRTYGIEFSPDSRYLYTETSTTNTGNSCGVGNIKKIFQYDIYSSGNWSNNPIDISGDLIDESRGSLQLGPDGKIYVAFNCKPYLGVISDPTRPGVAANFIQNAVPLYNDTVNMVSSHSAEGLPNVLSQRYFNTYNNIEGRVSIDVNSNGCNLTDPGFPSLNLEFASPTYNTMSITDSNGSYLSLMINESYTITPNPENPTYWNFSPANVVVDFPTQASPFTQDFCVTANGSIEDLEVIVVPLEQARPGFDTDYKVVVKNKGNQTASGLVTLDFEEDFMTLLSSTPTAAVPATNQLSWPVSNLQPFQMEEYAFTMTLNTPTQTTNPLNGNDILTFTGVVTGTGTDAMPADNTMVFDQTVVNSYDPNDKTCLEGKTIDPSDVGEYVHYMIRFENTGTASAVNIVIKDEIDLSQFDITTLIPLGGSHDYYTRVRDNNVVEFIHENINLDFNDATNDGYVLFKIKTLNTLIAGDTFDNTAEIYFDFNFPIVTNTETVTIMTTASIGETTDNSISVYPNPARDFINITSTNVLKSATLIDVNGRTLSQTNFTGNTTEQRISMENLTSGVYFATIQSDLGQKVEKVIVE